MHGWSSLGKKEHCYMVECMDFDTNDVTPSVLKFENFYNK